MAHRHQRILALDIGELRTGLALAAVPTSVTNQNLVSTGMTGQAHPFQVIDTQQIIANNKLLAEIIEDYEVASIVIGLPLLADGTEGKQARRVRSLATKLLTGIVDCEQPMQHANVTDYPNDSVPKIIFFDERQSSKLAKDAGHSIGLSEKNMRGKLDAHAAAAFLQNYLDTIDS